MIEISLGKLVLLALVALIVLGPEKLPHAARTAGALMRRMRSGWDSVRAEVERELEIEELKRAARDVTTRADSAQAEVNAALRQARTDASSTVTSVTSTVSTHAAEIKAEVNALETNTLKAPTVETIAAETNAAETPIHEVTTTETTAKEPPHGGV